MDLPDGWACIAQADRVVCGRTAETVELVVPERGRADALIGGCTVEIAREGAV